MAGAAVVAASLAGSMGCQGSGGSGTSPSSGGAPVPSATGHTPPATDHAQDWRFTEAPTLTNHTQLTFPDRFVKAGESYFSPDDSRIIFQAIEVPKGNSPPSDFYSMYVATVVRNSNGNITGLSDIRRISPEGSANTCGWFHPTNSNIVLFGSTITPPSNKEVPGYQRLSGRYRWQFPPEMRIVQVDLSKADGTAESLTTIVGDGNGYAAEGSLSADGRTLLYTQVDPKTQGDLWVLDIPTGTRTQIVNAPGYDGGPFFSPDGKRIIYRSDRRNDNLLQIYTADVVFDNSTGAAKVTGVVNERPMTNNKHVNWCPYFHPDGHHFVYGTSQAGHSNYEVFMRDDRDPSKLARITQGMGADVLPVFSHDGKVMMWTAQRGADRTSQVWVADFDLSEASKNFKPDTTPES